MYACILSRVDGWMDGWMDAWMAGWMDGWMGGWRDGWMDAWTDLSVCCLFKCTHTHTLTVPVCGVAS